MERAATWKAPADEAELVSSRYMVSFSEADGGNQEASSEPSVSVAGDSSWIVGEVKRTMQKYMKQIGPK